MSLPSDSGYGSTLYGMTRQSQTKDQYSRPHLHTNDHFIRTPGPDDRRDYAPSSVSGLGSMADQFQSSMELSPETPIDPSMDRFQALAQVGVEHVVPYEQFHLAGDSVITSNYDFPSVSHTDHPSNFSHGSESVVMPWNANTMKRQNSNAQPGSGKRARLHFDSGLPTQDSNTPSHLSSSPGGRSPHPGSLRYSPQRHLQFSYAVEDTFNTEDNPSFVQHQGLDMFSQPSGVEQPTPNPQAVQAPSARSKGKSKTQRKQDKKHQCPQCGTDKTFSTSNDLDRHLKTVHGIIPDGEKVWLCQIQNCAAATKVWARLDNFKQHVIRMHGPEYAESAESMQEEYRFEKHGAVETSKGKSRGSNPPQRTSSQNIGAIVDSGSLSYEPDTATSSHRHINFGHLRNQTGLNNQTFASHRSTTNTPRSGNTSMTNHAQRSQSTLSVFGIAQMDSMSPPDGNYVQRQRMQPQRSGPRTIANHEAVRYSRQFLQDEAASLAHLPAFTQSSADLALMGEGMQHAASGFSGSIDVAAPPITERGDTDEVERIDLGSADPTEELNAFQQSLPRQYRENFERVRRLLSSLPHGTLQSRSDMPAKTLNETKADGAKAKPHSCSEKVIVHGVEKKCGKSFDKRSELKKHESRHLRKYGCTFDHCYKKFGTKWEWKRHEHNQHVQLEGWRCMREGCEQHFDNKKTFLSHLAQHRIKEPDTVDAELKACHLEKKWLGSYWCGFCRKIVPSAVEEYGSPMEEERNSHISNHIDGKHSDGKACDMLDWIELKANGKNKRQMREMHRDASAKPESDSEVHLEVHDDTDSDDDADAPAEDDPSPPATKQARIDTNITQQDPHNFGERRRSSVAPPAIIVSPADENPFASGFSINTERQPHLQRQRALSDLGPQVYAMHEVRVCCQCAYIQQHGSECASCMHTLCPNCKMESRPQVLKLGIGSTSQPGYGETDEDMDIFFKDSFHP